MFGGYQSIKLAVKEKKKPEFQIRGDRILVAAKENLPDILKNLIDYQMDFLKMEYQKIEEIACAIDQNKSTAIALSEANIKHNRYRDMGKFIIP